MERNTFAVAVGNKFGFIPAHEFEGITLDCADVAVRYGGENHALFRPHNEADAKMAENLVQLYGSLPLEKFRIEPVIMRGELEMTIPGFDRNRDNLMFGGYCFVCNGKEIPVDFSGTAWNIHQEGDKLLIPFVTGKAGLATDYFLDDCYIEDYAAAGYRLQDITAEFLSQATAICEFVVSAEVDGKEYLPGEIGRFDIKQLCFENGENEYPVSQEVLKTFNEEINKKKSLAEQLQSVQSRVPTDLISAPAREHNDRT